MRCQRSVRCRSVWVLSFGMLVSATPAGATSWWLSTAIGYGGVGLGVGALAVVGGNGSGGASQEQMATGVLLATGLTVGGLLTGGVIGDRADRKLDVREPLTAEHRMAVRAGTVLAGGTIGALVGAYMISSDDNDRTRSDEEVLVTTTGIGLLAGVLVQILADDRLFPDRQVSVAPVAMGDGGLGAGLRWTL